MSRTNILLLSSILGVNLVACFEVDTGTSSDSELLDRLEALEANVTSLQSENDVQAAQIRDLEEELAALTGHVDVSEFSGRLDSLETWQAEVVGWQDALGYSARLEWDFGDLTVRLDELETIYFDTWGEWTGVVEPITPSDFRDLENAVAGNSADITSNSASLADHDGRIATIETDYLSSADLGGYASEAYVDSAVAGIDLSAYATQSWVSAQGYADAADVADNSADITTIVAALADHDTRIVDIEVDYLVSADLGGYATETYLEAALAGLDTGSYATEAYVDAAVAGLDTGSYATEAYVDSAVAAIDVSSYATQSWVSSQGYADASTVAMNTTAILLNEDELDDHVNYIFTNSEFILENEAAIAQNASDIATIQSDYLGSADLSGYATQTWVEAQGYDAGGLSDYVSVDTTSHTIVFTGANVLIQSGAGATDAAVNGLGNLIIGYNEGIGITRWGSHNLVVGASHDYDSYGGIVAGYYNDIAAPYASALGGYFNEVNGDYGAVLGGYYNVASGDYASVSGGSRNIASGTNASAGGGYYSEASGDYATIAGGVSSTASGDYSTVGGGVFNIASGDGAAVCGGYGNEASFHYATVSGGYMNDATGYASSVSGGASSDASGNYSSVSGGEYNDAIGDNSSVAGGNGNEAIAAHAAVSGGIANTASGNYATVAGGANNTASGGYSVVYAGSSQTASSMYDYAP